MSTVERWHSRLIRGLLTVKPRQSPWPVALRNTLGVVLPLAVGVLLGTPQAGLGMTIGALTVMFSDQPGNYAVRFRRLLLASLAGALAALTGFTMGGETALMLPLLGIWTFAASLLVALGAPATRVGLTSIIVLLITSSRADPAAAIPATALIFAGGLLQTALAVLLWPLDRERPQRQMLADAFVALAAAIRERPDRSAAPPATSTINELQSALLVKSSQRNLSQERFYILVHEYDQIRLTMVAFDDSLHNTDPAWAQRLHEWNGLVATVLETASTVINQASAARALQAAVEAMDTRLNDLQRLARTPSSGTGMQPALKAAANLARHVRVVARNCAHEGVAGDQRASQAMRHLPLALRPGRPIDILRANLRWHSVAFRHALRCTVVVTAGFAVAAFCKLEHGYWLPMTAAIVLKPDFAATVTYGALRMLGTLVGLLLMTVLLDALLPSIVLRIAALAVLCFAFREMAPRHYGIGVAALSGMLVLMLALAGEPAMPLVEARATGTVGGCLLGLAAYLLWPSWERSRVRIALAAMLDAWSDYLHSLQLDDETAHSDARSAARAARSNAQASLERLRQEPRTGEGLLSNGEAFFIAGNRLARAAIAIDALLMEHPHLRTHPELQQLLDELITFTRGLAESMNAVRADSSGTERIAASVTNLRNALASMNDDSGLSEIAERFEAITATLGRIVEQMKVTHEQ